MTPEEATLCDAIASLSLPPQTDGHAGPFTSSGARYREIVSFTGIKGRGHPSPEAAIAEWRERLITYLGRKKGNALVWRQRPQIGTIVTRGRTLWRVYSRLVIE